MRNKPTRAWFSCLPVTGISLSTLLANILWHHRSSANALGRGQIQWSFWVMQGLHLAPDIQFPDTVGRNSGHAQRSLHYFIHCSHKQKARDYSMPRSTHLRYFTNKILPLWPSPRSKAFSSQQYGNKESISGLPTSSTPSSRSLILPARLLRIPRGFPSNKGVLLVAREILSEWWGRARGEEGACQM